MLIHYVVARNIMKFTLHSPWLVASLQLQTGQHILMHGGVTARQIMYNRTMLILIFQKCNFRNRKIIFNLLLFQYRLKENVLYIQEEVYYSVARWFWGDVLSVCVSVIVWDASLHVRSQSVIIRNVYFFTVSWINIAESSIHFWRG